MCIGIENQKSSFIITSAIFYIFLGIVCGLMRGDMYYSFYSVLSGIYSCIYHYYAELRYFREDIICSFFLKLHLILNYILWINWKKFIFYIFISEIFGTIIFYYSVITWKSKYKNNSYAIFHNIWHIYTGLLAFYVGMVENKINIEYIDKLLFILFIGFFLFYKKINL